VVKENSLPLAVMTDFHRFNYLHRASANANLAVGELGKNFKRILALALAKSAGKGLGVA